MKRLMVFAAVVAAFGVLSCDKERTSRDGGNPERSFDAGVAGGYFCGRGATDAGVALDYDMYLLSLQTGGVEVAENGYAGVGAAVLVDMNTPANGGNPMRILPGDYGVRGDGAADDYCFYAGGTDTDGSISPTYVYYRESSSVKGVYYPVTGGALSVKTSGSTYTITGTFVTSAGTFVFNYSGTLAFYDSSKDDGDDSDDDGDDSDDGGEPVNLSLDALNQGYAYYYGQAFNVDQTDYADWVFYIGEGPLDLGDENASFLMLELITSEKATTSVPDGTYEYLDISATTLAPFSMLCGYVDDDNYCYGTWFFGETDNDYYAATSGSAKIARDGDKYTIDLAFEDSEMNATLNGKFTATLEYVDGTQSATESASVQSSYAKGRLNRAICPSFAKKAVSRPAHVPAFIKVQKRVR